MWKSNSYEVVGRAHLKSGMPCQDKTLKMQQDGVFAIALADGAGSAKDSETGALVAVRSSAEFVTGNFEDLYAFMDGEEAKQQLTGHFLKQLQQKSEELGCKLSDLASTLLLAAVKDDRFLITHIGDGVIGYMVDGVLKVASHPQNGEFANETVFTTSAGMEHSMKLIKGKLDGVNGFVLMSDGSAASLYNRQTLELAKPVQEILKKNTELEGQRMGQLIRHLFDEMIVKRTTDDCSIAVLSRAEL
ncbi:MAG: protein phosphatase 2C domain-containing protein [Turicibacter sp.]|nr:protein phosphatase 2C domain-containing protein [Turicibacter sp.]